MEKKQKIIPHLWFDKEAVEAAGFYTSIFQDSQVLNTSVLRNTPSGTVDMVTIELFKQKYMLISAGPYFKFNPSISFIIACRTMDEADKFWKLISDGGKVLMEHGDYPFGYFGWVEDKYGLSWQILYREGGKIRQRVTPHIMFTGNICGKAEEAVKFYTSVFPNGKVGEIVRYGKDEGPDKEGTIKHAVFTLGEKEFTAMDSAYEHQFAFNEAVSFIVRCENQKEIDYYWEKLSADPGSEQCGWLKDKYGLSWQIVPAEMDKMMKDQDQVKLDRVTGAFLKMKKFDIEALKKAYNGK